MILRTYSLLAQLSPTPTPTKGSKYIAGDMLLIMGAAIAIFGIIFLWLVFVRGSKSELMAPRRIHKDHSEGSGESAESEEDSANKRRKKKKQRRREHRSRNPTLSETGGLPPPRPPEHPSTSIP